MEKKEDKILNIIEEYGSFDGSHHKQWVIDQIVRVIKEDNYESWLSEYTGNGEYSWDEGIAP